VHANFLLVERVRNLEIVAARRTYEAQLVFWRRIENQRGEESETIVVVVEFLLLGRHQADIGPCAAHAGVPSETFGVIAEAELAVG